MKGGRTVLKIENEYVAGRAGIVAGRNKYIIYGKHCCLLKQT